MSNLSEWAARFGDDVILRRLEHDSDVTGLYETQRRIGDGVPCYSYTTPIFHVWVADKEIATTMSYGEAYQCYCKWKGEIE